MSLSLLYLIIGLSATGLFILIKSLKSTLRFLKTTALILFIIIVALSGFILNIPQNEHVARAVSSFKDWVQSPIEKSNIIGHHYTEMPVIEIQEKVLLDVPLVLQLPELPRGCEVTSLTMLLNYANINVDKMTLAEQVKKDSTPYRTENGQIHFGNPHVGFVGDMYTKDKPGLGVYHEPISQLAEDYLPGKIKDLTGSEFQDLKIHLSDQRPVWVIINTKYEKLTEDQFQTWITPTGKVKITFREHSVVMTGYDQQFVYFNDPLSGEKNKKAPIKDFEESWVQMGRQAITYLPH
ncbi:MULTISPECIES: C39 family peptidase [unclassified Bacillus (in: firmicutes)]|uniref:C39 family peptidase n=1 Tax=unclassified Bacillus (in: firmicutes) TaxID=185979 RepID=UPI0020C8781A|nr:MULTISPECIES: C39 family peptidase [unclassified Bacillus (in: firmicutes)]